MGAVANAAALLILRKGEMSMREQTGIRGRVHIVLRGPDGRIKDERKFRNLVVDSGLAWLASFIGASSPPPNMSHIAIGTGSTAANPSQTALVSERARAAATRSNPSPGVVRWVATFGPGVGTGAIMESGLFNAASGGTMCARQTFAVINKGEQDTLEITWELEFRADES